MARKRVDRELLRRLPAIDEVLADPALREAAAKVPHRVALEQARAAVEATRRQILAGQSPDVSTASIAGIAAGAIEAYFAPSLRRVVNASGVIVHTNLGRSVLADEAIAAVDEVMRGYSTLEYDVANMRRGSRHAHCERLICALTGAEAAIAVNNNAAAVMMVLSEFASGHGAIVSRGELIEIGGSFRIPDIMELSRARMVEVGTTNKTHPRDYERATTDDTAMYLKVHPSNYRLIGFTEHVEVADLRQMADAENARREAARSAGTLPADGAARVLVYEDQGSGAFARLGSFGEYAEPTVAESLKAGADLVSFSGDKLLGGPQAGIVVGSKGLVDRLKANPLARALRLDKMTLAALEATLRLYLDPAAAREKIPTLRMLEEPAEVVRARAEGLRDAIAGRVPAGACELSLVPEISRAGGGALPMCDIDTWCVRVAFLRGDAQGCERYLQQDFPTPVITRIKDECVLCDARTVLNDDEIELIARALAAYFSKMS